MLVPSTRTGWYKNRITTTAISTLTVRSRNHEIAAMADVGPCKVERCAPRELAGCSPLSCWTFAGSTGFSSGAFIGTRFYDGCNLPWFRQFLLDHDSRLRRLQPIQPNLCKPDDYVVNRAL